MERLANMTSARGYSIPQARFAIGEVVRHRLLDFRGVIFDVDPASLAAVMRTTQKLSRAVMKAFGADGVTVQQFNEPAGGQVVFHLHVHVIPRFDGVALKPHTGQMEDQEKLKAFAEKIRAAL